MDLPGFWLTRPPVSIGEHQPTFARLERQGRGSGVVHHTGTEPVWAFLCWLCEQRGYMAHGTGHEDISVFEPRQSDDVGWFGNRKAVYASSDGIWAMFYAVMNRQAVPMTIVNSAVTATIDGHDRPLYFFGASRAAVDGKAFRHGWVYLLPGQAFECEPDGEFAGMKCKSHHCASLEAVRPIFRVAVQPKDFPFLANIHAYDDDLLAEHSSRNPKGFPWIDDI